MDPPEVEDLEPGQSFTVDLTVTDVTDLYSWDVNLTYDPTILNAENWTEGPFLRQVGNTTIWAQIDNNNGFMTPGSILYPLPLNGATGNGILATITFTVKGHGETKLHFERSKLNTVIVSSVVPIVHDRTDGVFRNAEPTTPSIQLIIGVAVAVGIVGIAVFLYMRRRT